MYKVYFLDGQEITNVESVDFGHDRDVKTHYGLESGSFPVAKEDNLKVWTIKTQQDQDTSLFDTLEKLLVVQDPSRLIITSDTENISEEVYLESYSKSELNAGVYDVSLKFVEYRQVSVKTTDIPYIARPGKIPVSPKTVVFTDTHTPYDEALKRAREKVKNSPNWQKEKSRKDAMYLEEAGLYMDENGNIISNPNLLEKGKPYSVLETINDSLSVENNLNDLKTQVVEPMFGDAWNDFKTQIVGSFSGAEREAQKRYKEKQGVQMTLDALNKAKWDFSEKVNGKIRE